MRIHGIDFTSRPSRASPIACAMCELEGDTLHVIALTGFECMEEFDNFLASQAPWCAGLDFPFGQPREVVEALGWPREWEGYVARVAALSARALEEHFREFRDARAPGSKHPLRRTDRLAQARSPVMLHGVPVAKMFHRGAPRLAVARVNVPPVRPREDARIAIEAYPALVARRLVGRESYKGDHRSGATPLRRATRERIVQGLGSDVVRAAYGVRVSLPTALGPGLVDEPGADQIDAVLCAVQAAWAWSRRGDGFGLPPDADPVEGWIADPATAIVPAR